MERAETPNDISGVDADDFAVGEEGFEDVGGLIVGEATIGGKNDLSIGNVEVGVGSREALVVIEDDVGHGKFNNGGLFAVGEAATVEHSKILLQGLIVLVPGIFFDDGNDGVGRDKAREVVDMAVGVIAHNAVAQPDDIFHTVVVSKVVLYLILIELRIAVGVEEARGGGEEVATAVDVNASTLHHYVGSEQTFRFPLFTFH